MTNETKPVPPIASVEDWYEVTNNLAALTPQILMLERANKTGSFDDLLQSAKQDWTYNVRRSSSGHAPMRDSIIRNKVYAFAWMNTTGSTSDPETVQAAYQEAFHEEIFKVEWQYLRGLLDDEEFEAQSKAGYDEDLSYYLEALAGYYCNRLLNLADGGEREVCDETSWTYKRLKELTPKLEERKMYDEFYVARSAVVHAFKAFAMVDFKKPDESAEWDDQASRMLMEFYTKPVMETAEG